MRRALLSACAVAVAVSIAPTAAAEDTVRSCIDASTKGQTLRQAGHLLAARQQMITCSQDACPAVVRSHCTRWLAELDNRIPSLVVRAQDAAGVDIVDARVTIDGKPGKLDGRAVQLDPGEHVVAVEGDRGRRDERVILVEGEASRLVMVRFGEASRLAPTASPAPPPERARRIPVGAWVLGGLGVAALGGATYFGLAANSQLSDLNASCSPHCTDAQTQPGRTDALVFDVLLGAGAAALGGALVWALAFPSTVEVTPVARGAMSTVTLRF